MSFFSRDKKHDRVLILHIGSGSVMGAIASIDGSATTISATATSTIPIALHLTEEQFEKEMKMSLDHTLAALSKNKLPLPNRAIVYFASPWYASQVRVAKMSRPTPFVVSNAFMNDMIGKELKAFEADEIAAHKDTPGALRPINSKVTQVKLNGYTHQNPLGASAREIEFSLFVAVAPERILSSVEETISRHYHLPVVFSSFLLASFTVARNFFPHESDFILADIGGEVTDVSIVREGGLFQSVSFPEGSNSILRKLSTGLGRSIPESLSLCHLSMEGSLEASMEGKCRSLLENAKHAWITSFQKAVTSASQNIVLPSTLLLSIDSPIAPWFSDIVRKSDTENHAYVEKNRKVIVLGAELFHDLFLFGEKAERNPFLMIETLACFIIGSKK